MQFKGLTGSAVHVLVPDTTGHLKSSCIVHDLMGQNSFVAQDDTQNINVMADRCSERDYIYLYTHTHT